MGSDGEGRGLLGRLAARTGLLPRPGTVLSHDQTYQLPLPPDQAWGMLEDLPTVPEWWRWLTSIDISDELGPGTVIAAVCEPPVPFDVRIEVELLEFIPEQRMRAVIRGDVEGTGRLWTWPRGGGTALRVAWEVRPQGALGMAVSTSPAIAGYAQARLAKSAMKRVTERAEMRRRALEAEGAA